MLVPGLVLKAILKRTGLYIGGPFGAALGAFTATSMVLTVEISEAGNKVADGNATFTDITRLTTVLEAELLAAGFLGSALGVVAAPGVLVITAVAIAGLAAVYYQNQAASDDAIEELIHGVQLGHQPWEIGEAIYAAYVKEVSRPKNIDEQVNTSFIEALNFFVRGDPIVLDLDGDGLELFGASGNVLFDYNADGIKTGTGWARPDDGFLVRDINNNGLIDTGRELFGIDTVKSNGALATQGFDALKDLDSNNDGFITSADAAFGELKVWQDANQDGISQSGELKTLAQLGITSIGVNGSTSGTQAGQLINNSSVALSATYTRNGVTRTVGAIDLEANNFFTEFPPEVVDEAGNPVVITELAQALPQMNGSGMVCNLRAANDFRFQRCA